MFLSISSLQKEALNNFKRFPVTVLLSIAGTFISLLLTEEIYPLSEQTYARILLMVALSIAASLAAHLYDERRERPSSFSIFLLMASVALPWWYAFYCSNIDNPPFTEVIRHFVLLAGVHFLVAFAPFLSKKEINGFWQFNKSICLRFLLSTLYAFVICVGIDVALLAVTSLFSVDIDSKRYLQIWIITVGIVQTWFFLAGIPKNLRQLETEQNYPRSLRVFAQYVLLPLSGVYLAILYAYGVKILWTMNWPNGWVGWLVSIFSAVGILTLLLLHPYQNIAETRWIKRTISLFYALTLPLTGLLLGSVYLRISDYGITESRYYLLVLAFWLGGVSLYFLISKARDIRLIPITLALLAFGTSFGFWGASGVSLHSQVNRLQFYLNAPADKRNQNEISAILDYIDEAKSFDAASKILNINLGETIDTASKALNTTYVASYNRNTPNGINPGLYYYESQDFTYLLPNNSQFRTFSNYSDMSSISSDAKGLDTRLDPKSKQIIIYENGTELTRIDLANFIQFVEKQDKDKPDSSQNNVITATLADRRITIILSSLHANTNSNQEIEIASTSGYILISPL